MATLIAVIAALGAACCFALASVMQHGPARSAGGTTLSPALLLRLARNPRWLAGGALSGLSFAIQGLALAFGPLTLVQPLAATDVLFALPMIAVVHRYRLTRGDWIGAAAVAGGIAVFLTLSPPGGGIAAPAPMAWAPVILAVTGLDSVSVLAAARTRGPAQVICLAAAAGVTFGVLDALAKAWVDLLSIHGAPALLRWEPFALLAAGLLGTYLTQSAYRAGALSLSVSVIDTLEPVSAVIIGATVFSEPLAASPGQLSAQLAGAAVAVGGIAALSRSSVADAETRPSASKAGGRPDAPPASGD
jgi:drug/metabolite transporter (DMT)-like permease